MKPRTLASVAALLIALLTLQGCTKTVYYAVMAPHQSMEDQHSCFRQCQMLHAGKTKEFLLCLDSCPDARVERDVRCPDVQYDRNTYGCTTMQNHAFDGVSFGIGIGFLVLLTVLITVLSASSSNNMMNQI